MQGRSRFEWREEPGQPGQSPATRWVSAKAAAAPGSVPAPKPPLVRKPKTRRRSASAESVPPARPQDLLEGFCPEPGPEELIAFNSKGQMLYVRLAEIEWMEAADDCVKLHVGRHVHRLRDTLPGVADKLPAGRFVRISRATLVNREQIKGLQRLLFDEYEVLLRTGQRLPLARAYYGNLQQAGLPLPVPIVSLLSPRLIPGRPASN